MNTCPSCGTATKRISIPSASTRCCHGFLVIMGYEVWGVDLTWQSTTMHTLIDGNILSETSIPFLITQVLGDHHLLVQQRMLLESCRHLFSFDEVIWLYNGGVDQIQNAWQKTPLEFYLFYRIRTLNTIANRPYAFENIAH